MTISTCQRTVAWALTIIPSLFGLWGLGILFASWKTPRDPRSKYWRKYGLITLICGLAFMLSLLPFFFWLTLFALGVPYEPGGRLTLIYIFWLLTIVFQLAVLELGPRSGHLKGVPHLLTIFGLITDLLAWYEFLVNLLSRSI